ncbi:30S ribosomal protein S5 [Candidatus Woesearchaeota archaeon]|nr:30S ribosomal protein S5 [Candidatus Woesearchaeota archaeon]
MANQNQQINPPNLEKWEPKTELGKKVKNGEITSLDYILENGFTILESEIVDSLLPNLSVDLLEVGQSKGKFGGGKGSIWRQTQKKTAEGNRITFSSFVVIGNRDGYVGVGYGSAKETVPAREKAIRNAKLNVIKIRRACGSWACNCKTPHSLPFKVHGKSGSVQMILMPAPRGTGLTVEKKCRRILALAGIQDAYSHTFGTTATKLNLFRACFAALQELTKVKVQPSFVGEAGVVEGSVSR